MNMRIAAIAILATIAGCKKEAANNAAPEQSGTVQSPTNQVSSDRVLPPQNIQPGAIDPPPSAVFTGRNIGEIPVGTSVWIEPWTVWVADACDGTPNQVVVNTTHPYFDTERPGTIKITRTAQSDWLVDLNGSKHVWVAMKFPGYRAGNASGDPVRFRN